MTERTYSAAHIYRRLLRQIRPYWLNVAGLLVLSFLSIPLALLLPIPLKIVVDNVLGSEPMPEWFTALVPGISNSTYAVLAFAVILVVLIALLSNLVSLGYRLLHINTSERMVLGFRSRLFSHAQRMSLSYHDTEGTTDTSYRIFYDAPAIQYLATDGIIPFITAALTFFSMIFIIARLSRPLTLVALCISPILFILAGRYRKRLRRQYRQVKRRESGSLSVVQEALSALRVVKAFGQERREENRFRDHASGTMRARLRLAIDEGTMNLLVGLAVATGTALVLFIGTLQVVNGVLTLGGLILVMSYLAQLYSPLQTVSRKIASLQSHLASAERAFTLLDQGPDVYDRPGAQPITRANGRIVFENVSFAYETEQPVLNNVSLEIERGTRVGIAGQTGAGKSTMMNLLARFYDPTQGRILLDGVDLRDFRVADLRNQFSIVLQDTLLFATTIRENIAYARSDADDEEIAVAARTANIHDFIMSQPDGYDTVVGERGMRLSGGERQRIALARAFLKDAPILILDEPTSSVDVQTETGIMEAMERLMVGRTTFIVAHRLSTIRDCDLLLEIDNRGQTTVRTDVRQAIDEILAQPKPVEPVELPIAWSNLALPKNDLINLAEHPAAQAWLTFQPSGSVPGQITPLKFKPNDIHKSATFRLGNVGLKNGGVIAKRCLISTARLERTIYRDILPHAHVTAPLFYGLLEESEGSYCWLFLESVDGQQYTPKISSHGELAAEWLALLHTQASQIDAAMQLPAQDATRYLNHLRDARLRISSNMGNVALSDEDRIVLGNILNYLDLLESRWTHIEAATLLMPSTVVHGDFVSKNMQIRERD
ncbi:MAG: ABC transporter transmembrane domain-containing protein, partial [Candidatus Promineifilaceae bacterium]